VSSRWFSTIMSAQNSSLERKERNEGLLRSLRVAVNPGLPQVESDGEAKFRDPKEVARRAIVLYFVISVAHGANRQTASAWLKEEGLWDIVSPKEKEFLESNNPTEEEIISSTWQAEALWMLLWALAKIEKLELPKELCDVEVEQNLMSWTEQDSCTTFVNRAELRSPSEILNETDLIYRIHWAIVDARLNNKETPGGFDPGVVYERHYALNWLTCYSDNWDDVTTDT
jgi:hypothetical protein